MSGRIAAGVLALALIAIVPSQIANAGAPDRFSEPAGSFAATAVLDTSQVEAPEPVEVPTEEQYADEFGQMLGEGWQPFNGEVWESDTLVHTDCWINVGDTSVIACPSGFTALS